MGENRPEELAELEMRARWALEHPEQLKPREAIEAYRPMLRLWHFPAFFDYTCWAVLKPAQHKMSGLSLVVRKVIWERTTDLRRFADPLEWLKQGHRAPPTIVVRDPRMPADQFTTLLAEVALAPVPAAGIKERWSLDGERFGFENLESGFLQVRLEWWCDGPDEWQAFTRCVARMRAALEQCFSAGDRYETR
ncbi:MAG TPA: hypothetical protein VFU69_00785 [Ktedonobacterales bacterium]|nr:hypothetical protein [Ktedonobacterales bacterium]